MSMIGNYLRVSEAELEVFIADSNKLNERIYENTDADPHLIDVDKAWEGLYFLLTGQSLATSDEATAPLAWILLGPVEIDPDQDLGYGPDDAGRNLPGGLDRA